MISAGLNRWQQDNRFRVGGSAVYGVYQGVGFSVVEEDGGKLFVFMLSGADDAFDSIESLLGGERGDLHEIQVGDVENYLALFFDESGGVMSSASMDTLLDFVVANFRSCGFKAPNVCIKCGAPATKRSFHDNMVQPMCAECREAEKNGGRPAPRPAPKPAPARADYSADTIVPKKSTYDEEYDEYADFEHKRRMPPTAAVYDDDYRDSGYRSPALGGEAENSGLVGALLGALAGLIPYFATALIPFELAALCFVSGILAAVGYIMFSGRREKSNAIGMIITATELLSVFSVLMVNLFENYKGTFAQTLSFFGKNFPWLDLIMAILGALLGVAVSVDRIQKYVSDDADSPAQSRW